MYLFLGRFPPLAHGSSCYTAVKTLILLAVDSWERKIDDFEANVVLLQKEVIMEFKILFSYLNSVIQILHFFIDLNVFCTM